jgi:hypothetical protein
MISGGSLGGGAGWGVEVLPGAIAGVGGAASEPWSQALVSVAHATKNIQRVSERIYQLL